jgi:methyltransferase
VLQELHDIDEDNVYVVDDEAFIQSARMSLLADEIAYSGVRKRFHMYVRSDTVLRSPEIIEQWAAIGLDSVLVGAETMDDGELDDYQKGTSAHQTQAAIQLLHSLGVKVRANFIIRQEYGQVQFRRLADVMETLGVDYPSFSVLTPLPGTVLYEQTRHQFISDNPDLFDCYHTILPTRLPLDEFYSELAMLLRNTARRDGLGDLRDAGAKSDHPLFYYANDNAFEQMVAAVRRGYELNSVGWRGADVVA